LSFSENFSPTPKALISASVLMLLLAAIFAGLNLGKVKNLRASVADANAARESADLSRAQREKELKAREGAIASEQAKLSQQPANSGEAEGQLTQILT